MTDTNGPEPTTPANWARMTDAERLLWIGNAIDAAGSLVRGSAVNEARLCELADQAAGFEAKVLIALGEAVARLDQYEDAHADCDETRDRLDQIESEAEILSGTVDEQAERLGLIGSAGDAHRRSTSDRFDNVTAMHKRLDAAVDTAAKLADRHDDLIDGLCCKTGDLVGRLDGLEDSFQKLCKGRDELDAAVDTVNDITKPGTLLPAAVLAGCIVCAAVLVGFALYG